MNIMTGGGWGNTILQSGQLGAATPMESNVPEIDASAFGPENAPPQSFNQSYIDIGKKALSYFHDRASQYTPYYYATVDELATSYTKDPRIMYEGLGGSIVANQEFLTDDKVKSSMEAIADKGAGTVPANMTTFFSKLGEVASNPSVLDAISYTVTHATQDFAQGLSEFADTSISSLKSANLIWKYLPWIGLGVGILVIFSYAKGLNPKKLIP